MDGDPSMLNTMGTGIPTLLEENGNFSVLKIKETLYISNFFSCIFTIQIGQTLVPPL